MLVINYRESSIIIASRGCKERQGRQGPTLGVTRFYKVFVKRERGDRERGTILQLNIKSY